MTETMLARRLLRGLRVVDCSRGTAGPRAAGVLADYGADVVWVEPPGGDPWRDTLGVEYAVFNRGKRSIELDLQREADRTTLHGLLDNADVFFASWKPGAADGLGLAYNQVHLRHPHLVCCSISGFGADGPNRDLPGHESLVHALVGSMGEQTGFRDEGPIFEALPFGSAGAAYLAVIGTLAALYRRSSDGVGRHVETSILDGALVFLAMMWGDTDARPGKKADYPTGGFLPAGATRLINGYFRCADDEYIGVHTGAVGAFGRLMGALDLADRIAPSPDGMDLGMPLTAEERAILERELHAIFEADTRDNWVKRLVDADVCAIEVLRPTQAFDTPQGRHNGVVLTVDDPELGGIDQVAPPITFADERSWALAGAPLPGQHSAEVLDEWSGSRDVPWLGTGPVDDAPLLEGVHILDCGAYYAGPASSRHLADLGADVIKLENLSGDMLRGLPRLFQTAQAGKRSIAVDMKDAELAEAREALLSWADIIHHNMRPGVAERLGLGLEQARALNQSVVYGHAPGWGYSGPDRLRQSFEPMLSGYVGAAFEAAGQYNSPVYPLGNADPGNGLVGAVGMLLGLLHRLRTGEPTDFVNSQLNAAMTATSHIVRTADGAILNAERLDPLQCGLSATDRLYETADGWICVAAFRDDHVAALGDVLEIEILGDVRFSTRTARKAHDYELYSEIAPRISRLDTRVVLERLRDVGVPCAVPAPHNNYSFMRDPENRRTGRVGEAPHRLDGRVRDFDQFLRISHAKVRPFALAPEHGEHTAEILLELGYDAVAIDELVRRGAARVSQADSR